MPAKPPSYSLRCSSRAWAILTGSSIAEASNGEAPFGIGGMLAASHSRARARKASTLSMVVLLVVRALLHPEERGEALPVLVRPAVEGPVQGDSAQIEVDVVLPRDADPAVHLHAVLHDLGGAIADEGRRRAHEF